MEEAICSAVSTIGLSQTQIHYVDEKSYFTVRLKKQEAIPWIISGFVVSFITVIAHRTSETV